MGHANEMRFSPSPRMMIGNRKKEPDTTMNPTGGGFGVGVLDGGFGFPFPNLVVEVASAERRKPLLADLPAWISAGTSVQVAIGIKITTLKGKSVDNTPTKIEAFLYRRSAPANPEQYVVFHPLQPGAPPPVLRVHLSDHFFGVAPNCLPSNLQRLLERDEIIEVDLDDVRERILQDGFK